ncbi:MAG: bifunctional oligoribonuclease/PAP phosphatase NrnA [bacterium]|nr:MAG: bifunctional oligoribonuclease/PAP phosphatase NrnA [bacterium]
MKSKVSEILNFIKKSDNFLITAHQSADGDAFASILATAYILENWDKNFHIIIHDDSIDQKYQFLWGIDKIKTISAGIQNKFDSAIVLDVPSMKRIGDPARLLPPRERCVKIDHHPIEEDFAEFSLVDTQASSTSQLIYELIEVAQIPLTTQLAQIIFTGIMYDTGRFSFSNTRRRDFEIAAVLTGYDVKPHIIANYLFFSSSFQSMKILGYALNNLQIYLDGILSIIFLPYAMMKNNNHAEIEELANYSVAIRGVEVGLFIREVEPNFFKVSLRSRGKINVNLIAKSMGGGGHEHAAGTRFRGNFEDLKRGLIAEVEKCAK